MSPVLEALHQRPLLLLNVFSVCESLRKWYMAMAPARLQATSHTREKSAGAACTWCTPGIAGAPALLRFSRAAASRPGACWWLWHHKPMLTMTDDPVAKSQPRKHSGHQEPEPAHTGGLAQGLPPPSALPPLAPVPSAHRNLAWCAAPLSCSQLAAPARCPLRSCMRPAAASQLPPNAVLQCPRPAAA